MKNRILLFFMTLALFVACEKPIHTPSDVINANLKATAKNNSWENIYSKKTTFNLKTIIGDKTVSDVMKIKSIHVPFEQKTETFNNDTLTGLILTEKDKSFTIKFEKGSFFGINEVPKENVVLNPILKLRKNSKGLVFKDTLWQDSAVYKLVRTEPFEEYIFDKQTKYLIALITHNRYGKSTVTYSNYQAIKGYVFPFKEELRIPEAGYGLDITIENIEINPSFESDYFLLDESWVSLGKGHGLPDFRLPLALDKNQIISSTDLKGKITLIDFWATWCKPCHEEFPTIKRIYNKYKDKGFDVVSISIDKDTTRLKNFLSKRPFPWQHSLYSKGEFNSELAKRFQLVTLPKPILIDENGTIIAIDEELRSNDLETLIEKYFKDDV